MRDCDAHEKSKGSDLRRAMVIRFPIGGIILKRFSASRKAGLTFLTLVSMLASSKLAIRREKRGCGT